MTRSRSLAPVIVALATFVALPKAVHAQTPTAATDDGSRVRDLFRQGAGAMKDGKYAEARQALLEAWTIRRTYDVAAILGQAELELKLYRDAAEHLDFALRNIAPRESAETLGKIKTGLHTARQQVAEIRLSTSEPNASISVDGQPVGTTPLESAIFVAPGQRSVEARLDDGRVATQTIQASTGSAYTVDLVIPARSTDGPVSGLGATQPPANHADRASSPPSLVPVFVGGGIVLVGAGLGIGYRIAAGAAHDDLDALRAKNGRDGCVNGDAPPAECDAQRAAAESVDSRRNISTAGFIVAGAAAVGTAVYWFWPRSSSSAQAREKSRFLVSGAPAPGGGSVIVSGSF